MVEMGPEAFAKWLIEKREGLRRGGKIATQDAIARRAGVSRSAIAMIEAMARPGSAMHQPSREMVEKLARAVEGSTAEARSRREKRPGR